MAAALVFCISEQLIYNLEKAKAPFALPEEDLMSNEKKMLYTILTVVLCVVGFLLVRHMVLQSQNKLSDRVAGTYTAEYDITYAVDEAIEGAYNVDINDGEDEVHFNAEIILAPDKTFTLSFDTNGFNEELLIYCAKLENDLHLNIDEFSLRSYMAQYLTDLFERSDGTYEVDGDEISFSANGLSGLHADRRSNNSFDLNFILTDGTEFWLRFYK